MAEKKKKAGASTNGAATNGKADFGDELQKQTIAVRLRHTKFGLRRALKSDEKAKAAKAFNAKSNALSASKKKLNTANKLLRAISKIRSASTAYYEAMTVAYPDFNVRLLNKKKVEQFEKQMESFRTELLSAAKEADKHYDELKKEAQDILADLYDPADYPSSLSGQFDMQWEFLNVQAPDSLKKLSPELYERESQRVRAKFTEAVSMAEDAFIAKLNELVTHLIERLTPAGEGEKKKLLFPAAVNNLTKFFKEFQELSLRSDDEVEALVEKAQAVMDGVKFDELKKDASVKKGLKGDLTQVKALLDKMVEARPSRKISFDD